MKVHEVHTYMNGVLRMIHSLGLFDKSSVVFISLSNTNKHTVYLHLPSPNKCRHSNPSLFRFHSPNKQNGKIKIARFIIRNRTKGNNNIEFSSNFPSIFTDTGAIKLLLYFEEFCAEYSNFVYVNK